MVRAGGAGIRGAALALALAWPIAAAAAPEAGVDGAAAGAKLQALHDLLADPDIQALLARRTTGATEAPAPTVAPPGTMATSLAGQLQGLRGHLLDLVDASRTLPAEADTARAMVAASLDRKGWWSVLAYLIGFVALGFGAEWLFRYLMRPANTWLLSRTLATVDERVRAVFARLGYGLGIVLSFGLGSVGAFLLFDWPAVIKELLLGTLIAVLMVRLAGVAGRILLAPGAARFRVVPITTAAAAFLYWRWLLLVALAGAGWQTIGLFERFGLDERSGELLGDGVGLLILAVAAEMAWRLPPASLSAGGESASALTRHRAAFAGGATALLVLLWMLWVSGATELFWLGAFAAGLPLAVLVARRSVNHILRPSGSDISSADNRALTVVVFERGARGFVIVGAALLLGRILGVDFISITMDDTLGDRLLRSAVGVVIVVLLADFLWHVLKALIDRKMAASLAAAAAGDADAGHAARLQTLLPIISNILLVTIVTVAVMMALTAAGVQIAPLIASAGVVGVAVGFGAQTLVKDIISGIFYLFDDAFRVGEYIQSGSYKGTVESFSLRSVKLRHQRGALYTVPFGILGAVQNQSRDWVVDKIVMNVPYGTDLERTRKIVKKIGQELLDDPEFAGQIINPLKMQGVVQFGDYAIQIQTKMMTKPGDVQFAARRRALLMINAAFGAAGIGFAVPMVHVAGGGGSEAAAASLALEHARAARSA